MLPRCYAVDLPFASALMLSVPSRLHGSPHQAWTQGWNTSCSAGPEAGGLPACWYRIPNDVASALTSRMPALQSQTHGYTDYPFLDEATKAELASRLHPVAEVTSVLEKSDLAAVEPPSAVAAA